MDLFDITKSLRNEFVIISAQNLLGDEIFVSAWFYLPADWMLYGPDGLRWYSLMVFFREYDNNYLPYMCLHISQPKIDVPEFDVYVFWRKIDNSKEVISHVSNFSLPRGRWFPVQYYLKRDPTAGILKVWMDGKLICDKSAIETKVQNEYYISIAKIYHEPYDNVPHQLWVDDIELRKRSES